MILSVLNLKRGVGKTTLAINIAAVLAESGSRVLLLDVAGGDAAARQSDRPSPFQVLAVPGDALPHDLPAHLPACDHIVLDCPGLAPAAARAAARASDLVAIPAQPSTYDLFCVSGTLALLDEADGQRPSRVRRTLVMNRAIRGAPLGHDVQAALLADPALPPLIPVHVHARQALAAARSRGQTVIDLPGPDAAEAAQEMRALTRAILALAAIDRPDEPHPHR